MKVHNLYSVFPRDGIFYKLSGAQSATAYFSDKSVDLISGKTNRTVSLKDLMLNLDAPYAQFSNDKRVIHFFYEAGFDFVGLIEELPAGEILAIDITYSHSEKWKINTSAPIVLSPVSLPSFENYQKKFSEGHDHLKAGNCYQFNLTEEFIYSFDVTTSAEQFLSRMWNKEAGRGDFAFATYSEFLQKLYLSNSPECLFSIEGDRLTSQPIKGTMLRKTDSEVEISLLWEQMITDKKSQAELYMITDLIRNDLSRIDLPRAQVTKKKAMMLVPKLIHQYAEIELKLRDHVTLKSIVQSLFPGGSITGAPKKRVMQILQQLEQRVRRFYCGSTLTFGETISASINIRSCEIDFAKNFLSYQAGGGITLLSEAESEFAELTYKHDSFIERLTL